MIIKKHTFQSGGVDYRVDYIIFDDKNIHINKRGYKRGYSNSIDAFCIYDIIIISFYLDLPGLIYDVESIEMSYDSILNNLLHYTFYIKVEEDSDEFKEIMNLYNTLI